MRAGTHLCSRPFRGAAVAAVLACGMSAYGQEFNLYPIKATGTPFTLIGGVAGVATTIEIAGGGAGIEVEWSVTLSGWNQGVAGQTLGAFQGTINSLGYASGAAGVLDPKGNPGTRADGAFQRQKVCAGGGNVGNVCTNNAACPASSCIDNVAFLMVNDGCAPLCAVATITLDYEYGCASTVSGCGAIDPGAGPNRLTYGIGGTLITTVPANAAGTFTIDYVADINKTFMNDQDARLITGHTTIPGKLRIKTGSCCTNLGPGTSLCTPNVSELQCNGLPTTNTHVFRNGAGCPPLGPDCPACTGNADCRDGYCANNGNPCKLASAATDCPGSTCSPDACTDNICTNFVCSNPLLYNPQTQCCKPSDGSTTLINDDDPCTGDSCTPSTGVVTHAPLSGNACDDGFACTTPDVCVAGVCVGTDVNTITCASNAECPLGECNTTTSLCECSESTPLCVEFQDKFCDNSVTTKCQDDTDCSQGGHCIGDIGVANCYNDGDTVNATVQMGAGSECVSGGQFLIDYDCNCLDLRSIGPCAGSIFTNVIQSEVDRTACKIFYAVTSNPTSQAVECTPGPAPLACLTFTKKVDCDGCSVCLISENPKNTMLSNEHGYRTPLANCGCSKPVRSNGKITLTTPPGASVNADCAHTYATVNWNTASATDTCDGALQVSCVAQHDGGLPISGLIATGGRVPQGKSFFSCTATNSCGDSRTNVWTVKVSDQQTLDVEVQLCPVVNTSAIIHRAITFCLYADCSSEAECVCNVIDFGGPYNFPGHGTGNLKKVDKNNYLCITAQDCLHTLRSVADVECVGNHMVGIFKGPTEVGGNCLIGGNLDGCKDGATYGDKNTINILDFGKFMAELAAGNNYEPNGDTTCTTAQPHGDINADGVVDALDYAFIVDHFLENSKGLCCAAPGAADSIPESNPITEISVKELRAMGQGELAVADLNKDGMLNLDDMAAYMQGVQPTQNVGPDRNIKGRARGTR